MVGGTPEDGALAIQLVRFSPMHRADLRSRIDYLIEDESVL
jgi:hypothetical protein